MVNKFQNYNLTVPIKIGIAPEYFSKDVAMLSLLKGSGDVNNSQYNEKTFTEEIKKGNVVVALVEEDPVAYAIIRDKNIIELYISYTFQSTKLERLMKEYVSKHM
jgi:hypothetical protein